MSTVLHGSLCEEISVGSKADIRDPLSLPAHERSRFAYSAFKIVTIQDVQPNRPQTRALHVLSLHSQLLSEANGRSAHSKMKIHPIANEFA